MKIKIHNSLAKFYKALDYSFILDDKTFIHLSRINSSDYLMFSYKIDDMNFFLGFNITTKTLEEWWGFGENKKNNDLDWFKENNWKEMSK